MIAIAFPFAFLVREPEAHEKGEARTPRPAGPEVGAAVSDSILDVFRQPAFYLLALGSMASIGAVGVTSQNLKLYFAMDRGLAQGQAAWLMSLVLIGSIAGRLLMGWLADRWSRKRVTLLNYLIVALAIPLVWAAPSPLTLGAAAVVFGIGLGGDYMIDPHLNRPRLAIEHTVGRKLEIAELRSGLQRLTAASRRERWLVNQSGCDNAARAIGIEIFVEADGKNRRCLAQSQRTEQGRCENNMLRPL